MAYPDCEACTCESYEMEQDITDPVYAVERINYSVLIDSNSVGEYTWTELQEYQKLISPAYCNVFDSCEIDEQSFYYGINQGFGGKKGDLVVIDDLMKDIALEINSTICVKQWNLFNTLISGRAQRRSAQMVIVSTRYAPDDLLNFIKLFFI